MTDQGLARRLADFERRLKAMERGDRLTRSSIVVDDTGRSLGVAAAVVTGSREAALAAARALNGLLPTGAPAGVSVWFTDAEPGTPTDTDLWLRAVLEPTLAQYVAGVWVDLADQAAAPAVAGLRSNLTTDDGRIVVWLIPTEPAGPAAFGDLWLQAPTVAYRWEGEAGWQPLVAPEGQSLNYVDGENGWTITPDGDSQFRDLAALGQVSGAAGSFDSLEVGGVNILSQLADSSIGKLISARMGNVSNPALSTTLTKIFELNCGIVPGGRTYRVSTAMLLDGAGTLALTDRIVFSYRYTLDGSTPTVSSPTMDGGFNDTYVQIGEYTAAKPEAEADIATTAPLKVILCAQVVSGAGTYAIYTGPSARARPVMALYDDGPLGARNDAAISQVGGGVSRYTKTFNAAWVFGIGATYPATSYFVVGDGEYGIGGQYGLIGFDSAAIVAGLVGSTSPISCTLKWRPRTRKTAGGFDTRIVTHNYASRALAEAAIQYPEGGWSDYPLTAVVNVNNTVPNTLYSTSLGLTPFAQFKAGTKKGVGMVTQIADTYAQTPDGSGTIYGDGTYEMQLVFVYDGTS